MEQMASIERFRH